jgi:non-heme chloroperoxidase
MPAGLAFLPTRPVPGPFFDMVVGESLKVPARVWRDAFEGLLKIDHADRLGSIASPTLIIWGDQDAFCPRADQDALLAAIPDARLTVYAGAGHALHWEEPSRYAADVAAYVASL